MRTPADQPRALCVRPPWSMLLFLDKDTENRGWFTRYRGTLYILSGKTWDPAGAAFAADQGTTIRRDDCPTGWIGRVDLRDVHVAGACCAPWGEPHQPAAPPLYHWTRANPELFTTPIPGRGFLGLRPVPPAVFACDDFQTGKRLGNPV